MENININDLPLLCRNRTTSGHECLGSNFRIRIKDETMILRCTYCKEDCTLENLKQQNEGR